jgi:hypothetical protein
MEAHQTSIWGQSILGSILGKLNYSPEDSLLGVFQEVLSRLLCRELGRENYQKSEKSWESHWSNSWCISILKSMEFLAVPGSEKMIPRSWIWECKIKVL